MKKNNDEAPDWIFDDEYKEGYWNHRVVHTKDCFDEDEYSIREVYYNDENVPENITVNAVGVYGNSIEELRETLEQMLRCLDAPVLEDTDF